MNKNDFIIRTVLKEDAKELLNYLNIIGGESDYLTFGENEFGFDIVKEQSFIENINSKDNSLFIVAEKSGKIIGNLNFTTGNRKRIEHCGEFGVSVLKEYWGKGIGSALVKYLIKWANSNDKIKKINLKVREDNTKAYKLYKKLGFLEEGRVRRDYKVDNIFYDSLLMGLYIDDLCSEDEIILKDKLKILRDNKYLLSSQKEYDDLAKDMLKCIGSFNSELRDDMIYSDFCELISNDFISKETLKEFLKELISDKYIFNGIGLNKDNGVYKRTFSLLIIALIIWKDNKEEFLSKDEVREVLDKIIKYYKLEKNIKGYDKFNGWAHAVAHGADVFNELVQSKWINKADCIDILDVLLNKVSESNYVYIDEESERIVSIIESMIDNDKITESILDKWLDKLESMIYNSFAVDKMYRNVNIKVFLRSLYFRFIMKENINKRIINILANKGFAGN